jgi:hypothetical protein
MFTTSILVVAGISLLSAFLILRAQSAHKDQEADLTADELKTFNERYRFKSRTDMPARYDAIRVTSDRLRRTSTIGMLAVIASIAYVIIAGPSQ